MLLVPRGSRRQLTRERGGATPELEVAVAEGDEATAIAMGTTDELHPRVRAGLPRYPEPRRLF